MKFARYLDENCTQEWKRAYIDYKRLKKCIKAVAAAQDASSGSPKLQTRGSLLRRASGLGGAERGDGLASGTGQGGDAGDVKNSDEDDGRDDDSDDSDRVDQGPWAGHKPSTKSRKDTKETNDGAGKKSFWLGRRPSIGIGGGGIGKTTGRLDPGDPVTQTTPVITASPVPSITPAMPSVRPSPATGPPSNDRTPRQYGAMGSTPPSRRKRDPSPPPPLDLPEASAPSSSLTDGEGRHVMLGESTIISPDESLEDSPSDKEEKRHSDGSEGNADRDIVRPLPSTGLIQHDQSARSPSGVRFGQSQIEETARTPKMDSATNGLTAHSSPGSRMNGLRSPRLQSALGSLRRATVGGTDPLPRPSLSKVTTLEDRAGVRFPANIDELYSCLNVPEAKFFDVLDGELAKVDNFYTDRLKEAVKRSHELRVQLQELAEHRRIFHEAEMREGQGGEGKMIIRNLIPATADFTQAISNSVQKRIGRIRHSTADQPRRRGNDKKDEGQTIDQAKARRAATFGGYRAQGDDVSISEQQARARLARPSEFSPELYQKYKRKLRVAVLEYYKELEVLKNYRILNVTGFKKALKKFEKTAKIQCLDLYMTQKVAKASFHDGQVLEELLKEMEDEYTVRFEKGDHKKAVNRLRGSYTPGTHYYSTFLSGTYIGLGIPAMVLGLVRCFDPAIREQLPQWNALLQIYSIFFVPVLMAMLFELNLAAYVQARINYTFIMEIDVRTAIDYRCFLEIPALLFFILCYCFFFSISRVGEPHIAPWAWPIVWVVFTVIFFLNPIPIYYQHARYWLLSLIGRVLTPGYSRVEFIAFFVADELNSLVYSISNLWFLGCAYNKGFSQHPDMYLVCSAGGNWVYSLLLVVPALIRAIQCLKRYKDSGLPIHLVNLGKYTSVMLQYALFALWRSKSFAVRDYSFALWVVAATLSAIYTSSWDLFVDWGLLRPSYGFLRETLAFPTMKNYYYAAMVTNVLIRFIWIGYIPRAGLDYRIRSFVFGMLEMLRRWQWNFYRLDAEMAGNSDNYRISKEVPLPYVVQDSEDELIRTTSRKGEKWGWRNAAVVMGNLRKRVASGPAKEGLDKTGEAYTAGARGPPGTINAGPRGDFASREYERRLPPDEDDSDIAADEPPSISRQSSGMHRRAEDL